MNVQKLYRLAYITRFSNVPRIRDENVAEHSFYVAVEVLSLYEEYHFDLGIALQMAITHDFLEADIDDINHDVKMKHPDINKAIKAAEKEEQKQYPKFIRDVLDRYHDNNCIESQIVKLADVKQCSTYALNEIHLGNFGYMYEVYKNSFGRSMELKKQLEDHKR